MKFNMGCPQIVSPQLNSFLACKQKEILALAQRNTEEVVKKELALADFELLLAVNMPKQEIDSLTKSSKRLRQESWEELFKKFNGNTDKIQEFLDEI